MKFKKIIKILKKTTTMRMVAPYYKHPKNAEMIKSIEKMYKELKKERS